MIKKFIGYFQRRHSLILLFVISVVIGYILGYDNVDDIPQNSHRLIDNFSLETVIKRNSIVFMLLMIGFISFGIINLFTLFINAVVVGIAINSFIRYFGILKCIAAFLPHGIIEIAVYIEISRLSLRTSKVFLEDIMSNFENTNFIYEIKIYRYMILYVILICAALVEVYLTPIAIDSIN